jgi:Ni/Co efflux regulator RcnB
MSNKAKDITKARSKEMEITHYDLPEEQLVAQVDKTDNPEMEEAWASEYTIEDRIREGWLPTGKKIGDAIHVVMGKEQAEKLRRQEYEIRDQSRYDLNAVNAGVEVDGEYHEFVGKVEIKQETHVSG